MRNDALAVDYVRRASVRIKVLELLFAEESWADVVREAQEVVELALKGLLRAHGVEPPRIHDVSEVLIAEQHRLPEELEPDLGELARISKDLRRDRELAFYGAEDLTPSGFYSRDDAQRALDGARTVVSRVAPFILLT